MPPLMKLPEYEYPKNALINFAPINDAIDSNRQNALMQRRADMDQERLGMERERLGMAKTESAQQSQAREVARIGKESEAIHAMEGPQRQAIWQQWTTGNPSVAAHMRKFGIDPNDHVNGPKFLAMQAGSFNQLDQDKTRAQIEADRARTASSNASAAATNAQLSQLDAMTPAKRLEIAPKIGITDPQQAQQFAYKYSPKSNVVTVKDSERPYEVGRDPATGKTVYTPIATGEPKEDDKEFRKFGAQQDAKRYSELVDEGNKSRLNAGDIGRLEELSAKIGQLGKGADVVRALGPYANALGIKVDGLDDIQAFSAITSRLAPAMRPPGSGATSDFEFKQFLNALPQMSQTENGRKLVLNQLKAMNDFKIASGDISDKVLNGSMTRVQGQQALKSLGNPLTLWRQKNPTDPQAQVTPGQPSVNPAAVVQGIQQKIQSGEINPQALIAEAEAAIASGKPREAVLQRLQQLLGQSAQPAR